MLGTLWILATASLWSVLGLFSKFCLGAGMPPLECAFFRALFGALAFVLHCTLTGRLKIPLRHALLFMAFGAWGIGAYFICAQYTVKLSGAAMDIILQYTAPFWVAVFARWFFKEKFTRVKLFSMLLAALGTICVCLSGGSIPGNASVIGITTGLVSGLCYATHYPFTRWWQQYYSSAVIFTWMLIGGSIALIGVLVVAVPVRFDFPLPVWGASAAMGLVCTYLAYICYGEALKRISLVRAVVTSELEPVLSMTWVWLAFGECFSPVGWLGSILIVVSVLVLTLFRSEA